MKLYEKHLLGVRNMSSVWDTFVEASYIMNRDFILRTNDLNLNINLSTGYNNIVGSESTVHVKEYHTVYTGTCYQITGNLSILPPGSLSATLEFDKSLNQDDIPPVCISIFIIHILVTSI